MNHTATEDKAIPIPQSLHFKTWRSIKSKYPEAIVLLRMEDYYFAFDNDAFLLSSFTGIPQTLSTTLYTHSCFPFHQLDHYLNKLVKAGYRAAICDQLESP